MKVYNTGRGWGYAVAGVRPTPKLYRTEAMARAAERRAIKRLVAKVEADTAEVMKVLARRD